MIFVTVGVQLPFDRLIKAVDDWAGRHGYSSIVAQAGATALQPRHIDMRRTLVPAEFRKFVTEAELIISHAGMGSIITALELGKRILVMPRRAALGEHRNDHQLATARYMAEQNLVTVADDADQLIHLLDDPLSARPRQTISRTANQPLISRIATFLDAEAIRRGVTAHNGDDPR